MKLLESQNNFFHWIFNIINYSSPFKSLLHNNTSWLNLGLWKVPAYWTNNSSINVYVTKWFTSKGIYSYCILFGNREGDFSPRFFMQLALWHWANCLKFLGLSFHICKIRELNNIISKRLSRLKHYDSDSTCLKLSRLQHHLYMWAVCPNYSQVLPIPAVK